MNINKRFPQKIIAVSIAMAIGGFSGCAAASTGITGSQIQKSKASAALLSTIQQNLQIFTVAAQKYVFENAINIPWNINQSQSPIVYTPFLLYAASSSSPISTSQAQSICGFSPTGKSPLPTTAINGGNESAPEYSNSGNGSVPWNVPSQPTPSRYLPAKWHPVFHGTYCAVVTLNQPAAKQSTVVAYYVTPSGSRIESHSFNVSMPSSQLAYSGNSLVKAMMPSTWDSMWKPTATGSTTTAGWKMFTLNAITPVSDTGSATTVSPTSGGGATYGSSNPFATSSSHDPFATSSSHDPFATSSPHG